MGLYETDFRDVGRPRFMGIPYVPADGLVVILPRRRGGVEEQIEVTVMLREDDMEGLRESELWRSWGT